MFIFPWDSRTHRAYPVWVWPFDPRNPSKCSLEQLPWKNYSFHHQKYSRQDNNGHLDNILIFAEEGTAAHGLEMTCHSWYPHCDAPGHFENPGEILQYVASSALWALHNWPGSIPGPTVCLGFWESEKYLLKFSKITWFIDNEMYI